MAVEDNCGASVVVYSKVGYYTVVYVGCAHMLFWIVRVRVAPISMIVL